MKLFRKIFLQAILGVLVISQITLVYCLYFSQKQTVADRKENEQTLYIKRLKEFSRKLEEVGTPSYFRNADSETVRLVLINTFREVFGSQGAIYRNEECLYNTSPYEFDYKGLKKKLDQNGEGDMLFMKTAEKNRLLLLISTEESRGISYGIVYCADITEIYDRTAELLGKGLTVTLILLFLAGVILYRTLYSTMRPLFQLKKAAASIASGDFSVHVPEQRKDEIGELARSFNQMSVTVQQNIEALTRTNETQRRMLGSLAHELKTPMTAIIGYADTLLTVRLSDQRREQALTYIEQECRRLSRLSVKMLELTGLYQEGKKALKIEKCQVKEVLKNVEHLMEFKLREKEINLEIQCSPRELCREMDQDMMTSLLVNLVDNACKASENGGKILIAADEQKIIVRDQGKGIPPEELSHVTEAFYMVDKSRSRSVGSVGLGLSLCREIAELHGARLFLTSRLGEGTTVTVQWLQNGYNLENTR